MLSHKYIPQVILALYAIFMGSIMTLAMVIIFTGSIPFPGILLSILIACLSTFIAGLIVPAGKLGGLFANKVGVKDGSIGFILLSSIIPAVYYTIVQTFVATIRMTGFTPAFWSLYWPGLAIGLLVGYAVSVICTPLIMKLTQIICSKSYHPNDFNDKG